MPHFGKGLRNSFIKTREFTDTFNYLIPWIYHKMRHFHFYRISFKTLWLLLSDLTPFCPRPPSSSSPFPPADVSIKNHECTHITHCSRGKSLAHSRLTQVQKLAQIDACAQASPSRLHWQTANCQGHLLHSRKIEETKIFSPHREITF